MHKRHKLERLFNTKQSEIIIIINQSEMHVTTARILNTAIKSAVKLQNERRPFRIM